MRNARVIMTVLAAPLALGGCQPSGNTTAEATTAPTEAASDATGAASDAAMAPSGAPAAAETAGADKPSSSSGLQP